MANAKIEESLADAKVGEKFQFVRMGYFTLDSKCENVFNRTVALKTGFKPAK
jgi:glutaminyl-tRNA synthetase